MAVFAVLDGVREDVRVVTLAFDVVIVGDDAEENGLVADVVAEGVERVEGDNERIAGVTIGGVVDVVVGVGADVEEEDNEEDEAIDEDERLEFSFGALTMRGIFLCFFFCCVLTLGNSWLIDTPTSSSSNSSSPVSASKVFALTKLVPGAEVTAAMKPPYPTCCQPSSHSAWCSTLPSGGSCAAVGICGCMNGAADSAGLQGQWISPSWPLPPLPLPLPLRGIQVLHCCGEGPGNFPGRHAVQAAVTGVLPLPFPFKGHSR